MNSIQALSRLKATGQAALRTADAACLLDTGLDNASHLMARLAESGHLVKLKRGLWMFSEKSADSLVVAPILTAPMPAYVSLQTALYYHGMISQMAVITYVVSLARTQLFRIPAGCYSIHHLDPEFFFGYERNADTGAALATPEKALLDFLYLSPARSGRFAALPELEIPPRFSMAKARRMIARVSSPQRRSMLARRFEEAIANAEQGVREQEGGQCIVP
jgi:predicted transcriptional regulator of viral defense system